MDGYRLLHPEEKGFTFPTWDPHLRLDYVFVPTPFTDRLSACQVVTETSAVAKASDHFPLLARVEVG